MRPTVGLRAATLDDAEQLVELWGASLRRGSHDEQVADVHRVLTDVSVDEDVRVVVAEGDGEVVGALHLRLSTVSPVNLDPCVQAMLLRVREGARGRGVGQALMEAAVAFAEERGAGHVMSGALASSREGNRFLARLGLAAEATIRLAPTSVLRAKVGTQRNGVPTGNNQRGRLLAARRRRRQPVDAAP